MKNKVFLLKILQLNEEMCYNITNITSEGEFKMTDAIKLSKYIIHYYNENDREITNLKLQKILYYVQGYTLKYLNIPAFKEKIYNWKYGPVVQDIYFEFNEFANRNILLSDNLSNNEYSIQMPILNNLLLIILNKTFDFTAYDLVEKTHNEIPWCTTKRDEEITIESIHGYFSKNNPLKIEYGGRHG